MEDREAVETPEAALARALFAAGVAAADPGRAVREALALAPRPAGRRLIVAVGKAACAMAAAAREVLGAEETLIVTTDGAARAVPGAEVLCAGHPVPDARGLDAARRVAAAVAALGAGDELVALISGGGSALLPAPLAGISIADKAEVSRLLLASGADIRAMNLVRQHLSTLKGGGLARLAAPARVRALVLSDVVGDDLSVIASGPTAPPIGTRAEARALIARLGLGARIPASVRAALDAPDTPPAPPGDVETRLVGSNTLSLRAMAAAVPAGAGPLCLSQHPLEGDVAEAAALILRAGAGQGAGVWLWGGETTVRIEGPAGQGGRNQELALRVALGAQAAGWTGRWAFLSGGSDGRDGPTEAAGGIVGPGTIARIRAAGLDPEAHLARHDSLPALRAGGALLVTGETGTNVADFQILVRGAG